MERYYRACDYVPTYLLQKYEVTRQMKAPITYRCESKTITYYTMENDMAEPLYVLLPQGTVCQQPRWVGTSNVIDEQIRERRWVWKSLHRWLLTTHFIACNLRSNMHAIFTLSILTSTVGNDPSGRSNRILCAKLGYIGPCLMLSSIYD